jgi:hypothetical protein
VIDRLICDGIGIAVALPDRVCYTVGFTSGRISMHKFLP